MRRLTWWRLRRRLAAMQVLVLDVDGVLTDGGLWHGPEGELIKRFDVRDGLGIKLLQEAGLEVAFLSGGRGGATEVRAQQLGIRHCLVGVKDKPVAMAGLRQQLGVDAEQIVFVGDDMNDLAVQGAVGLLVATADAAEPLRRRADAVLRRRGGHGAVRELAERLLQARGLWAQLSREGWRDRND
jgi:3-deoxy-D-manno-octulosonate 8-phosphate phosphatase (KDO 8-P phosphatase)